MPEATKTAAKKPGKQPQDRQAPAEPETPTGPPDGYELLKPYAEIKGSDQIRLLAVLSKLQETNTSGGDGFSMSELELLADAFDLIEKYGAKDPAKFAAFTAGGMDGINRGADLTLWWLQNLGE